MRHHPSFLQDPATRKPISPDLLIRFEAANNYTHVYVAGLARPLLYAYTLAKFCAWFPFMARVHKTHAINPAYARATHNVNTLNVQGTPVTLSRRFAQRLDVSQLAAVTVSL